MKNYGTAPASAKILHSPAKRAFFIKRAFFLESGLPQVPQHRLVLQRREHPLAGLEVQFGQAALQGGVESHPATQLLAGAAGEMRSVRATAEAGTGWLVSFSRLFIAGSEICLWLVVQLPVDSRAITSG